MPQDKVSVQLRSGPMEALVSGTVFNYEGLPLEIIYNGLTETIKVVFEFIDDNPPGETSVRTQINEPDMLKLYLHNFSNPIGNGSKKPILIGTVDGRPTYLHYRVQSFPDSDKVLHYTLYSPVEDKYSFGG